MEEQLMFPTREDFRQWLTKNHANKSSFWVILGKGGKVKTLTADEALEEALCYGWIDGLIKSVDASRYMKKFSPRRKGSNWSARNKAIVERLIKDGKMTPIGLKAIEEARKNGTWDAARAPTPDSAIEQLIKDINGAEPALSNYTNMPERVRRIYAGYYAAAKKEETRVNRIKKIIGELDKNNKSPMM
jgi:uncharacterized protein YdeI (YjbR/CyaY-like superfamily)